MEFYSIWPYFAGMVLLLALASAPFFAIADTPPNPRGDRLSNLDGLRGFLAFGVFFHHSAIYHQYFQDGQWVLPPSCFYTLIGPACVALFFMITGYLFWGANDSRTWSTELDTAIYGPHIPNRPAVFVCYSSYVAHSISADWF